MKKLITLCFLTVVVIGCKKNETTKENETITEVEQEQVTEEKSLLGIGCYGYEENGTKISFEITEVNDIVLGNLNYAIAEKDKNTGTFSGILNDSILIGTYIFQSEGQESKREIAFKVTQNQLIEGYGELNEDGTQFKNTNHIEFNSTMPLSKIACK